MPGLKQYFIALILTVFLSSCLLLEPVVIPTATPVPSPTPRLTEGWQAIMPGLERRIFVPPQGALTQFVALRIDPDLFTFRAHYRPASPLTINQWQEVLPDAVAIVNANFFTPDHQVLGLLVSDGQVYGQSYQDRGGTFLIQDGQPGIRSNIEEPYRGEPLEQAVQAFPMLVQDGQPAFLNANENRSSRRTVIGLDAAGNVLLMVTPGISLGLYDLSAYVASADIGFVDAFNLDGGGSTMLSVPSVSYQLLSRDPVPAVLAVYLR